MGWQLIFKAPEDGTDSMETAPPVRKPVSVTLQLDPDMTLALPVGDVDDEDD